MERECALITPVDEEMHDDLGRPKIEEIVEPRWHEALARFGGAMVFGTQRIDWRDLGPDPGPETYVDEDGIEQEFVPPRYAVRYYCRVEMD